MIEVKLQFPDQGALIAFFVAAATGNSASLLSDVLQKQGSAIVTPEKQEAARASTAAGKAEKATRAPAPSPVPTPGSAPAPAGPDRTEVSAKIVKLAGLNQDAAVALLGSFNVKRAKELTDDQLADALVAVDKALATADMG